MKSFYMKTFLVLLLIASSDCGVAQMITNTFCAIRLLPFKLMLQDAIKGKSLVLKFLIDAINDRNCGGYLIYSQLPENLSGLYFLTKDAPDIINKLFNIQVNFKTTILDQKIPIAKDDQFNYFVKFNVNADTTIKPEDKGSLFNIKVGASMDKDSLKWNDIDNPITAKIQELTGFDIKNMALSLKSKLPFLPDGSISLKSSLESQELTFSSTSKLGPTNLNGSISIIAERSPNNIKKALNNNSENLKKAQELCAQLADSVGKSAPVTVLATAATALALSIPQVRAGVAAATAALSAPMEFLYLRPIY